MPPENGAARPAKAAPDGEQHQPRRDVQEGPGYRAGGYGWFKAMRGPEPLELLRRSPPAFNVAYVIASRARWHSDGFNPHNLALGEAFLGDFENYGMSQQEYRTAKKQLAKWGFATFRSTSRGTIGRLVDTRLFSVLNDAANEQEGERATKAQPAPNVQSTTNQEGKELNTDLDHHNQRDVPPSLEDVQAECLKLGLPVDVGEIFWNYHEAIGWEFPDGPVKSWRALLRCWKGKWERGELDMS